MPGRRARSFLNFVVRFRHCNSKRGGCHHGVHTEKRFRTRRRFRRSDPLVCARRQGDEGAGAERSDGLALLWRDPRFRPAAMDPARLPFLRRSDAKQRQHPDVLAAMPARQLVLPALAPRLCAGLRGRGARRRSQARRACRLGAALLELFQAEPEPASSRLRLAGLAGRAGR